MTSGELRGLTLKPVSTRTPVTVELTTADGTTVRADLTGFRYEPGPTSADGKPVDAEGRPVETWEGERLVLLGTVKGGA